MNKSVIVNFLNGFSTRFINFSLLSLLFLSFLMQAKEYQLPLKNARLIGEQTIHKIVKGDYLHKISEQYNVGLLALTAANPGVDPFFLGLGSDIIIPSAMLLPFIKHEGIVVNLPELRMYYFLPDKNKVHVFPVGIGKKGFATPKATSYISSKRKEPIWRPTKAMRQRYLVKYGKEMVNEILPGPDNPFGQYALRLGKSEYLIHGTNQPFSIGMRESSGCIRMYDDDIKWLYENVPLNTKVRIIEQPIKMSYENGRRQLIEVHSLAPVDKITTNKMNQEAVITQAVKNFVGENERYWQQLTPLIKEPRGLIIELGK